MELTVINVSEAMNLFHDGVRVAKVFIDPNDYTVIWHAVPYKPLIL